MHHNKQINSTSKLNDYDCHYLFFNCNGDAWHPPFIRSLPPPCITRVKGRQTDLLRRPSLRTSRNARATSTIFQNYGENCADTAAVSAVWQNYICATPPEDGAWKNRSCCIPPEHKPTTIKIKCRTDSRGILFFTVSSLCIFLNRYILRRLIPRHPRQPPIFRGPQDSFL